MAPLRSLILSVLSYLPSFVFLGINWNNDHQFQIIMHVDGRVLWANLHPRFWFSRVPFVTNWLGTNSFARWLVALYWVVLRLAALAYSFLVCARLSIRWQEATLATPLGDDFKGNLSLILCRVAIPLAFVDSWLASALHALVAAIWLVPDPRLERTVAY